MPTESGSPCRAVPPFCEARPGHGQRNKRLNGLPGRRRVSRQSKITLSSSCERTHRRSGGSLTHAADANELAEGENVTSHRVTQCLPGAARWQVERTIDRPQNQVVMMRRTRGWARTVVPNVAEVVQTLLATGGRTHRLFYIFRKRLDRRRKVVVDPVR